LISRRTLVLAALLAVVAAAPVAQARNYEESPTPDPARPAIGEWIGHVSWNASIVTYVWTIYPDGTFTSGRFGRGQDGGGGWGTHGDQLTLKYTNGFRYTGELRGNAYGGTAYSEEGRAFGGFSLSRARKNSYVEESE
jgi:hypothetical protein